MEYSSNIKFSNNLTKNCTTTVTYSGYLFEKNSESVTIVYGFGNNWENTTEKEMDKTEQGFTCEIKLLDYDKFNFCFRNSNNEWDNNFFQNFSSPISEPEIEEAFILNENIINEILDNLFERNIAEIIPDPVFDTTEPLEVSTEEKSATTPILDITTNDVQDTNENIQEITTKEATLSFEPTENPTEENNVEENNLENTDSIQLIENSVVEEKNIDLDIQKNEPINIEETLISSVEEDSLCEDLNKMFAELCNDNEVEKDNQRAIIENFDMDALVDEILSPIVESSNIIENKDNNVEDISDHEIEESIVDQIEDAVNESLPEVPVQNLEYKDFSDVEKDINDTIDKIINSTETEFVDVEKSLLEDFNSETETDEVDEDNNEEESNQTTALVEVKDENAFVVSPRSLGKFYMFKKKVKLAVYKFFTAIPKILSFSLDEENNK